MALKNKQDRLFDNGHIAQQHCLIRVKLVHTGKALWHNFTTKRKMHIVLCKETP